MAEKTAIEWCDATLNPWWGASSGRRTFGDAHWAEPRRWARTMPAKLGRRPRTHDEFPGP